MRRPSSCGLLCEHLETRELLSSTHRIGPVPAPVPAGATTGFVQVDRSRSVPSASGTGFATPAINVKPAVLTDLSGVWRGLLTETNPLGTTTYTMTLGISAHPLYTTVFTGTMQDNYGNLRSFIGTLSRTGKVVIDVSLQGMFSFFQLAGQLNSRNNMTGTLLILDTYGGVTKGTFDFSRGLDLAVTSLVWDQSNGGLKFSYAIMSADLHQDTTIALYWAKGKTSGDRLGQPFYVKPLTRPADKSVGVHTVAVAPNEFLSLPTYRLARPRLDATYILAIADPNYLVPEVREANNLKTLKLLQVKPGSDYTANQDGEQLDMQLLKQFMDLASYLIAHNLVSGDIQLNEAVRSRKTAHRWSTIYSILNSPATDNQLLQNLRALPNGTDLDGNKWYDAGWETGLGARHGSLTAAGRTALWKKIKAHALALARQSPVRSDPYSIAAEGYPVGDAHRLPNTFAGGVSNHVGGHALDASIPWRAGARLTDTALGLYNLAFSTGEVSTFRDSKGKLHRADPSSIALVTKFGLKRPVWKERWHFELQ